MPHRRKQHSRRTEAKLRKYKEKVHYDNDYSRLTEYGDRGKIGDGGYGKVYAMQHWNKKGKRFAIKELAEDVDEVAVIKEIRILQKLKGHPNIIELVDICKSQRTGRLSRLVFKLVESFNYKSLFPTLSPEKVQSLMVQLLDAVKFIHSKGIVHCDLKNRNLLVDKNYHLYVIDFGQAHRAVLKKEYSYHVGTLPYKPPEILMKSSHYDTSVDMWEVGRIFMEMLVPRSRNYFKVDKTNKAHPEDENRLMLEKWASIFGTDVFLKLARKNRYEMPHFRRARPASSIKTWLKWYLSKSTKEEGVSRSKSKSNSKSKRGTSYRYTHYCTPEALDLLTQMLQVDPADRITAEEALRHPYFQVASPEPVEPVPKKRKH